MALTPIEQMRLELGLVGENADVLDDPSIQYFLDKNGGSVRRAALDAAKTVLFILSQMVKEQSGPELMMDNRDRFRQYMDALKLYISDPNFSIAISMAQAYAGGISRQDVYDNLANSDNITVEVERKIPQDGEAAGYYGGTPDPFDRDNYSTGPFSV